MPEIAVPTLTVQLARTRIARRPVAAFDSQGAGHGYPDVEVMWSGRRTAAGPGTSHPLARRRLPGPLGPARPGVPGGRGRADDARARRRAPARGGLVRLRRVGAGPRSCISPGEARGGMLPLPDPSLRLGGWGCLRPIPSGLHTTPGDLGERLTHAGRALVSCLAASEWGGV